MAQSPVYKSWSGMKQRCLNTKNADYKDWGGRGITICNDWLISKNFINDMESSWFKGATLDRIDNNKGYSKENCRWATRLEQNNNRRSTKPLTYNGKTMSLSMWARELNIKRSTLSMRYYKYKWPLSRCFEQGVRYRGTN